MLTSKLISSGIYSKYVTVQKKFIRPLPFITEKTSWYNTERTKTSWYKEKQLEM